MQNYVAAIEGAYWRTPEAESYGSENGERIAIDEAEVEQDVRRFDTLLRHAKRLDDVINSLEKQGNTFVYSSSESAVRRSFVENDRPLSFHPIGRILEVSSTYRSTYFFGKS